MSDAIVAATSTARRKPSRRSRMRAAVGPLVALVRRDLVGGPRGKAALWTRGLAIVGASLGALGAYAQPGEPVVIGVLVAFAALFVASFLLAPAIAVSGLRRERESGMLELLNMSGISPWTLALGRILSAFLMLMSLLLAALPAMSLFWFYRRPGVDELGLASLILAAHFLAIAATCVAISAWSQHAGTAIALSVLAFIAWCVLQTLSLRAPALYPTPLVHMVGVVVGGTSPFGPLSPHGAVLAIGSHVAIAALAWVVARAGLLRQTSRLATDVLRDRLDRKRFAVTPRWPLTWLAQRVSAPARPWVQVVFVAPVVVAACFGPPELAAAVGALLYVIGTLVAVALGATAIPAQRERGTWDSFASTATPGWRILLDLVRCSLLASAVPYWGGVVLLGVPIVHASGAIPITLLWALPTWLFTATAGVLAGLLCTTTARGLILAFGIVVVEPCLSLLGIGIFSLDDDWYDVPFSTFDLIGWASWVALCAALTLGGVWLIVRAGMKRLARASLALIPALLACALPFLIEPSYVTDAAVACLLAAFFGVSFIVSGVLRNRGVRAVCGILILISCLFVPVLGQGMEDQQSWAFAFGGHFLPIASFMTSMNDDLSLSFVWGFAHQALLFVMVALLLGPKLERWLGRAG